MVAQTAMRPARVGKHDSTIDRVIPELWSLRKNPNARRQRARKLAAENENATQQRAGQPAEEREEPNAWVETHAQGGDGER